MKAFRHILVGLVAWLACAQAQAALVQITLMNATDMTLPTWSLGDPAVHASMDFCVYSTALLSGGYGITVSAPGGYALQSGVNAIPYSLSWDDGGAGNLGGSASPLTNNVKLSGQQGANILNPLCLTGANARMNINITQAAMTAALAGTYNSTLTLIVSPN